MFLSLPSVIASARFSLTIQISMSYKCLDQGVSRVVEI